MIRAETLEKAQKDLQEGMSIFDACVKYHIPFRDLCNCMPRASSGRRNIRSGEKYIRKQQGHYQIVKSLNGTNQAFGTYDSLEDAVKVREQCIKQGWIQKNVDEYCRQVKVVRRKGKGVDYEGY